MGNDLTLQEIVDANEFVLIDTSSVVPERNYPKKFQAIRNFSNLNEGLVHSFALDYLNLGEFLHYNPSIRTIPEVTSEIMRIEDSLSRMSRRVRNEKISSGARERIIYKLGLAREAIELVGKCSKNSECSLLDSRYEAIVDIVKTINSYFKFNRDLGKWREQASQTERDGGYRGPRISKDTDERLVASLIYACTDLGENPVLVSRDSGFEHLIRKGMGIILSRAFKDYNSQLRDVFESSEFKYYFGYNGSWNLRANKDGILYSNGVRISDNLGSNSKLFFSKMYEAFDRLNSLPQLAKSA